MAQDQTSLYNLAIGAIGSRSSISLPSEVSREAELCNQFYDKIRMQVMRAAPWENCRANKRLAVIKERNFSATWVDDDPEDGWRFRYGLPADFLQPINITSFQHFLISNYAEAPNLVTNVEAAILTYTRDNQNIAMWSNDLFMTVAQGLAAAICLPLNGKLVRKQEAVQMANQYIIEARLRSANMQNVQYDHIPDFLAVRGVSGSPPNKFIYPNGPLLSVATI